MPVWISFGIMAISYIIGIGYMCKKRIFGEVVVLGLLSLFLAQLIGFIFNTITGLKELQQINSHLVNGAANRMIFSLWQNPAWEEFVFRGIPLALLVAFKNKLSVKRYKIAIIIYFIIPSIAMVFYHIPNHGMSRIVDTLILSIAFAWFALKYSLWAPLILHYIFDSFMVFSLAGMNGINKDEIIWLSQNGVLINSSFSIGLIALMIFIPLILIWNLRKTKIFTQNRVKGYLLSAISMLLLGFIFSHFVH